MYIIGVIIALLAVVFGIVANAIPVTRVLDPASLIVVLLPALGGAISAYGFDGLKTAFHTLFYGSDDVDSSKMSARIFLLMANVSLGAGFIGALIGFTMILLYAASAETEKILLSIAAAILPIIYGAIFKYFVFGPAAIRTSGKLHK